MQRLSRRARACNQCRKRKETCTGGLPCQQCGRRGIRQCAYSSDVEELASKRRKVVPFDTVIDVPRTAQKLRCCPSSVFVGDSSTHGFLSFVHCLASLVTDQVQNEDWDVLLETEPGPLDCAELTSMETKVVAEFGQAYLCFVHHIFDFFDEEELRRDLSNFSMSKPSDGAAASSTSLLLVLAIGAEQENRSALGGILFQTEYSELSFLAGPTLSHLQSLLLVTLYLLMKCCRNAAATHLGMAISVSHALGLHEKCPDAASARAWRCVRILDVSTSASLGRPCMTSGSQAQAIEDRVHVSGLELCDIAETILRKVYAEKIVSTEFALHVSSKLKIWASSIPGVLVSSQDTSDVPMDQNLSANHMTAAYYWTIILLTRPFLMDDVLARKEGRATIPEHSTFIDACIDSAFRCLDATTVLLGYSDLPPFLFLVVNTTLVSALVLVLAHLEDYDRSFPLQDGLEKAERFLQRQAGKDPQAAQYLQYSHTLRAAAQEYCSRRSAAEMKRRSAQVCAIFGAVERDVANSATHVSDAGAMSLDMSLLTTEGVWEDDFEDLLEDVAYTEELNDHHQLDSLRILAQRYQSGNT